jgi:hypothetical protein
MRRTVVGVKAGTTSLVMFALWKSMRTALAAKVEIPDEGQVGVDCLSWRTGDASAEAKRMNRMSVFIVMGR